MGTSMTLSQREKSKIQFRNHAMPRTKIPPEMERYYRYKAEYLKNKPQSRNNSENPLNNQNNWKFDLPNEIPSIEGHSEIINPKIASDHIEESSIEESSVEEWESRAKHSQECEKNVQSSQLFVHKSNKMISNFQPKSTYPFQEKNIDGSTNNIPNINEQKKDESNNKNSSNKRSSNKKSSNRPQSQSNHALSEIIFHREGQISTYIEKFLSEDLREQNCQSKYRQSAGNQKYQLKFVEEGHYEQESEQGQGGQANHNQQTKHSLPTKQGNFKATKIVEPQKMSQQNTIKLSGEQLITKINHNLILQINSSIKTCENSIKPILFSNHSCLSKNTNPTNLYSNSLSSSGRPRKLLYF